MINTTISFVTLNGALVANFITRDYLFPVGTMPEVFRNKDGSYEVFAEIRPGRMSDLQSFVRGNKSEITN